MIDEELLQYLSNIGEVLRQAIVVDLRIGNHLLVDQFFDIKTDCGGIILGLYLSLHLSLYRCISIYPVTYLVLATPWSAPGCLARQRCAVGADECSDHRSCSTRDTLRGAVYTCLCVCEYECVNVSMHYYSDMYVCMCVMTVR